LFLISGGKTKWAWKLNTRYSKVECLTGQVGSELVPTPGSFTFLFFAPLAITFRTTRAAAAASFRFRPEL